MEDGDLTKAPISKLIKWIAFPAAIGFFFNTMYNVTDTFFAGQISSLAQSALALSFPVFFIIIALGSGISSASTALVGHEVGEGNREKAKEYAKQALSFSIVIGIVIGIIGLLISPWMFKFLGASGGYLELALSYMNVMFIGTVFFSTTFTLNGILNAVGDTKSFRNFLIFGFILNVIFNPILMFGWLFFPKLGIAGIALATILIEVIGAIYLFKKLRKTFLLEDFSVSHLKPVWKDYKDLIAQGLPASFNMVTVAIGIFVITYFFAKFGEEAVAAYGIATRIEQVALLPTIGLNIAALSLVAQNRGAKKFDRVREAISKTLKYGMSIMVAGSLLVFFFAEFWMKLFSDHPEVIRIGSEYLRIACWAFFAFVLLFVYDSVFRGFKKPTVPLIIGIFRQLIFPIPIFFLIIEKTDWGLRGIFWTILLTVWFFSLVQLMLSKVILSIPKE